MTYKEFYDKLQEARLIEPIWEPMLDLINKEMLPGTEPITCSADEYLKFFAIYFCRVRDGNIGMPLDYDMAVESWMHKIEECRINDESEKDIDNEQDNLGQNLLSDIEKESLLCLKAVLGGADSVKNADNMINDFPVLIGAKGLFNVDNAESDIYCLYLKKYNIARKKILSLTEKLFPGQRGAAGACATKSSDDWTSLIKGEFSLSEGQKLIVNKGLAQNILVTGGPGTGKTTSILFLLLALLKDNPNRQVYLAAASGKAASRMKESIISGLDNCNAGSELIEKMKDLEGSTIHRLLGFDFSTNKFTYNACHKFSSSAIFVIDEASMIDICLFKNLLEAIPDDAAVFILGDKNQLPSVGCGAVFGELLERLSCHVVELDESKRFSVGSEIYRLASAVNKGDIPDEIKDTRNTSGLWKNPENFVAEPSETKDDIRVFYYLDSANVESTESAITRYVSDKDIIEPIVKKWGETFYKNLQDKATSLSWPNDLEEVQLNELFSLTERGRVLCTTNGGTCGVDSVNAVVRKAFIDKKQSYAISGFYPGELVMITKNSAQLDLYNGDSGVIVSFGDDKMLYLMVKKATKVAGDEYGTPAKIFKIGAYTFYPLSMIGRDEMTLAYAITVHKSQGSDYGNILVILPKRSGHPLLNRQILYTAITRTKGNTFILSNPTNLAEAARNVIVRDNLSVKLDARL